MRYDDHRARYEAHLERAHRAVVAAEDAADAMRSAGAAFDCHQIAIEICRLADDSLSGKRRAARDQSAQLFMPD